MKYKDIILRNFASLATEVKENKFENKKRLRQMDKEYDSLKKKNDSWFNKI